MGGGGGLQNGRGMASEVLPSQKAEGAEKGLAMLKRGGGGYKKLLGIFNMRGWSSSHAEGGHKKFYPVLKGGGGAKSFRPTIFPF